ncbi:MAG: hypothetical protein BECKG1743F_GA0114225_113072, partial [Candidatus Kentron sp. G]
SPFLKQIRKLPLRQLETSIKWNILDFLPFPSAVNSTWKGKFTEY